MRKFITSSVVVVFLFVVLGFSPEVSAEALQVGKLLP
jgi:hypothetical protein